MEQLEEITNLALRAGRIVCESSGETYRAEETISIIAHSLGADIVEPYVIPTGIMLYTEMKDKQGMLHTATRVARIRNRTTNLGKISLVNELSRNIALNHEHVKYESIESNISAINNIKPHNALFSVLIAAVSSCLFTIMLSGTYLDALVAAAFGTIMRIILFLLAPLNLSSFITSVIGSSIISFLSSLLFELGIHLNYTAINIGSIMYLMSGLAMVIAIRDIIGGDYLSGITRATEALVIALSVGLGGVFGFIVFPNTIARNGITHIVTDPFLSFMLAALVTATFAMLFYVKKRLHIFLTAIVGGIAWLLYIVLLRCEFSNITAVFLGSFSAGIISEIFALLFKAPSTVFFIPALISFVPGGSMYATMYNAVLENYSEALQSLLATISIAGSIALAIAFATTIARLIAAYRRKIYAFRFKFIKKNTKF
ncbi:MAG: threonine/serine exporter family protein [Spirochaetaceae bacterium]|nr:threonine/serine exporter family protein [Spirochaetaceae bacterium]